MAHIVDKGSASRLRWKVRYRTTGGQARSRAFPSKAQAQSFATAIESQRAAGSLVDPKRGRLTFGEWVERWHRMPSTLRPSSIARDNSYLGHRVLPHFSGFRLCDVTTHEIQTWADGLNASTRLAPASVHKSVQVLSKVLASAVRDGRLSYNPARGVVLPPLPDTEARFLTSDELLRLEDAMPPRWAVLVPFLADVGLRIGEVAALRWEDVDTQSGRVRVRQTYVEVQGRGIFSAPKTRAGRRVVPMLTPEIGSRMEGLRSAPTDLVFQGAKGGPLRPNAWRARVWRPAIAAAQLAAPLPTPHSLRHTAVAHWIAAGVEPFKLAVFAGHASVSTLYRVYGHLLDTDANAERVALSALRAAARRRRTSGL